jgi:hypothetical protein
MKKYIHLLNLLIIMAGFIIPTQATQVAGSDWSYTCVPNSNGLFNIRLILYRDCNGWAEFGTTGGCANATVNVQLRGADPGCNGTILSILTLTLRNVRDANPNPRCPDAKNICTNCGLVSGGTFVPAVERYEFGVDNVNLGPTAPAIPPTCCNVTLNYQQCCRSSTITTGAANANFYTEMTINRCFSSNPCNSSPTLANDPFIFLCGGQPFMYNNGVVDGDLDSLSFAFVPSLTGAGTSVNYNSPFAFNRPMPWTGPANGTFPSGINIDPVTGDIGFTPTGNNFLGVVAISIQQWRWNSSSNTYELVATTRRDFQSWLIACAPNAPPNLQTRPGMVGNPQAPRLNWTACTGKPLCFDIVARDPDIGTSTAISDTTYLSWNASIAQFGATFEPNYNVSNRSVSGPREDDYKFCWTPPQNAASPLPYFFSVRAVDSRCPIPASTTRSFSIRVLNSSPVSTITRVACNRYVSPSGKIFTETGNYLDTISNVIGCDSVIQINLTINKNTTSEIVINTCPRYVSPSGKIFTVSGNYLDTISISNGCDSIIHIDLTISNNSSSEITVTTCSRYVSPSGKILIASGIYLDTIPNSIVCDSVITINLTIQTNNYDSVWATVCNQYTTPSGKNLISSGTYFDTIPDQFGCDSVLVINLTLNKVSDKQVFVLGSTIRASNINASYQWLDCNNAFAPITGAINQILSPQVDGSYAVQLTENGCVDTSACVSITLVGVIENTFSNKFTIYPNPTTGMLIIESDEELETPQITVRDLNGKLIYLKQYSGIKKLSLNLESAAGIYFIELIDGSKKVVIKVIKE